MLEKFRSKSKNEDFSILYNENFDYVYSFVFIRTACDAQITEELVQETFTIAWQAHDRFKNKSKYRTWLCAIAKNKLYEHYRRKLSDVKKHFCDVDNIAELASDFDLETTVISNISKTQVAGVLNEINPIYRYALIMKYIDGYSVKKIAKNLGRTAKAVDGVLQKAKSSFIREYSRIEGRGNLHE